MNRRRVVKLIIQVTLVEAAVLSLGLLLVFGLKAWNEQRNEAGGIVQAVARSMPRWLSPCRSPSRCCCWPH